MKLFLKNIHVFLTSALLLGASLTANAEDDEDLTLCTSHEDEVRTSIINPFDLISNELLQKILFYLYGRDFQAAELTCRRFRANTKNLHDFLIQRFRKQIYQVRNEAGTPTALVVGDHHTELSEDSYAARETKRGLLFHLCRGGNLLAQDAVARGLDIIELLGLEDVLNERTRSTGRTSLQAAAIAGNSAFLQLLLTREQPNIDVRDYEGSTALHLAVIEGRIETLYILLNAEANPNIADQQGYTPLHIAAERGEEAMVRALARAGTNIDATNNQGQRAADLAAHRGHLHIVAILNGADVLAIEAPRNETLAAPSNNESALLPRTFTMHASR